MGPKERGPVIISASVVTTRPAKTWNITNTISNHWHHVVMTYDGMTLKFYHNSHLKLSDSECCYGDIVSRNNDVLIGHMVNDDRYGNRYKDVTDFEGYIDEMKLYKKTLTAGEVLKLYQLKVV